MRSPCFGNIVFGERTTGDKRVVITRAISTVISVRARKRKHYTLNMYKVQALISCNTTVTDKSQITYQLKV